MLTGTPRTTDRSEAGFPHDATAPQKLRHLLRYAILAPSGHNTQPWLFDVHGDVVDLLADRSWSLTVVDPNDRELVISCGAALLNLRVALRRFGYSDRSVELLPDRDDPDLLARVRLVPGDEPSADELRLFDAIPLRRTTRTAYTHRPVDPAVIRRLLTDADTEQAWLDVLDADQRPAVAELVALGDRLQMRDKRFRRELAACMHPNTSHQRRGIRGYSFGRGEVVSIGAPHVIRSFDMGSGRAAQDIQLAEASPVLAVLGTHRDVPVEWLRAGQAMERVLLRVCAEGMTASFLNQPIEVPQLRSLLAHQIGRAGLAPQLLLRMGFGPPVPQAPREVLPAVLTHRRRAG